MVEMRDVSVVYSGGVDALHNVNLKINDGDFAFVVGPSGAGKSTMIKLILKEINPSSGTVFVNGKCRHCGGRLGLSFRISV